MTLEDLTVEDVERLTPGQLSEVLRLVTTATAVDEVAPLSEQVLLAARDDGSGADTDSTTNSSHLLVYDGAHLAGYAHLERDEDGEGATAEVVVDPPRRRHGIGKALVRGLDDSVAPEGQILRLWSHGDLEAARGFALHSGFTVVRELWQMRRSLGPDSPPLPAISLPEGFGTRHFVVGRDEEAWLQVNARAFVDHPEQGRITRGDLDRRIAQQWFDDTGFILIEDVRGPAPVLAASHWTKVAPAEDSNTQGDTQADVRATEGEVYVVGVDPAYQGLGLGRTVTVLGLAHLREKGLTKAMLYVDADNAAAVATYSRLAFTRTAVDIMYSRIVHLPV